MKKEAGPPGHCSVKLNPLFLGEETRAVELNAQLSENLF
jgi:hypothetical protein